MSNKRGDKIETNSKRMGLVPSALLLLGGISTLSQVYLTREALVVLDGNELVLTLLLFTWLTGVVCGAGLARYAVRDSKLPAAISALLVPLIFWGAGIIILRGSHSLLGILPGQSFSPPLAFVVVFISVFPVGFCTGFSLPLLAGLFRDASGSDTGRAFAWDSLGSVIAGVASSFILLPWLRPFLAITWILALIALWALCALRTRSLKYAAGAVLLFCVSLPFFHVPQQIEEWSKNLRWNTAHPALECIAETNSRYQYLEIGRRFELYTVFGNGLPLFSFPNEFSDGPLMHLALSQTPRPDSLLLLSDRAPWLIPFAREHKAGEITCCVMDTAILTLIESIDDIKIPEDSGEIEWIYSDPRTYLSTLTDEKRFDCIFIDQPEPVNALINRLYTEDFYRLAARHLTEDGVLVFQNTGSAASSPGPFRDFGACLSNTLHHVFDDVLVLPGSKWFFFASRTNGTLQSDPTVIIEKWNQAGIHSEIFVPEMFTMYYIPGQGNKLDKFLMEMPEKSINTDSAPYAYASQLSIWVKRGGHAIMSKVRTVLTFALLVLFLAGLLSYPALSRRIAIHAGVAAAHLLLFAVGLLSMGIEMQLLIMYQSRVGCLYQYIGLFFAIFMLGLAIGGFAGLHAGKLSKEESMEKLVRLIITCGCILAIMALTTPLLTMMLPIGHLGLAGTMILLWVGLTAFVAGIQFPLIAMLLGEDSKNTIRLTASLEAADHAGGAIGAPLTGLVLLPLFGLNLSCTLLAVLLGIALLFFRSKQRMI